jgi:hypothetical protein
MTAKYQSMSVIEAVIAYGAEILHEAENPKPKMKTFDENGRIVFNGYDRPLDTRNRAQRRLDEKAARRARGSKQ